LEKTLTLDLLRADQKIKSTRPSTLQPQNRDEALVPVSLYAPLNPPTVAERLQARLPKRILSIDYGFDRAFVGLEFLPVNVAANADSVAGSDKST